MFEIILPLVFIALLVASYIDIKIMEVPDWISYGLMFAGIGIRLIYSYSEANWNLLFEGLLGLGTTFLVSCVFFYTGQWGGGDSKLLIGLGALFGIKWTTWIQPMPILLTSIFAAGAFYGMFWSVALFFINKDKCFAHFAELHKKGVGGKNLILLAAIIILIIGIFLGNMPMSLMFIMFSLFMVLIYYTWLFFKVLEKICMQKYVLPSELTEGDWIVEDIVVDKKIICGPKDLGIDRTQISELKKLYNEKKINKVLIKEGIPFVPSFFIGYLIMLGIFYYFGFAF